MPDERGFCFFDGRSLRQASLSNLRDREVYRVPAGWERCRGACVSENGFAVFGERAGGGSRLRLHQPARLGPHAGGGLLGNLPSDPRSQG